MMMVDVIYPKVSLEADTGSIARWLVAEGDTVAEGQVLFEIENDKAAVEVEAPAAGRIEAMMPEGQAVLVGTAVARILASTEAMVAAKAQPPVPASVRRPPNPTPLARRIARVNGLDPAVAQGTGPRGRVQKSDILALMDRQADAAPVRKAGISPDARLHAQWLRRGSGAPLVLLHGFAADLNNWRGLLAGAPSDRPVLALDLPCHGQSTRDLPDTLDGIAALAEATIAAETEGPMLLVGHSFGAAVAARMARRGAVNIGALCLFAPAGLGPEINAPFVDGILRAQEPASLRPWLELLVEDRQVISPAFLSAVVDQRGDRGLTTAMRAFAARFLPDGTQAVSIRDDLRALEIPLRVVFGRQDRILPFAATRSLPGNVALHAVDGCGHMPHLEHPVLARRILSEMASHL